MCSPRVTQDLPTAASSMGLFHREDLTMAPRNATTFNPDTSDGRTPRHPVRTILVFSLALAPLAILPYVLVRRHVLGLRKEIGDLRKVNGAAVKEMRMAVQQMSQQRAAASKKVLEELKETRTVLVGVESEVEANRKAIEENGARLERMENRLSELMTAVKAMDREGAMRGNDLKNMLSMANIVAKVREAKAQGWRDGMTATMEMLREEKQRRDEISSALGTSLADMAAFMQEVEIRQGWPPRPDDGRGIERTRLLAKRLSDATITTVCHVACCRSVYRQLINSCRCQEQHLDETKPVPGASAESTEPKQSILQ
ncbi:hypothetical protein C8T65DRAFT_635676 [Cerioporus squamosus]|nr:hypothetical protein C8T65DRAFT_635676 [Cerioporus squamosus]